jgi:hypothetical protein
MDAPTSYLDINTNNSEHCDEGHHQVEQIDDENEFKGIKFENLVLSKGPQQILQLILQEQVDGFMEEEITGADDYVG